LELLLESGWIRPRGRRRTPGRPLTFGTTDAFFSQFGLASLDALPGKDDLKGLGLLDPRAANALDVPRPSEELASDEEPLSDGDDAASFFVDHMDEGE
jgi:segregation and condensation protein B